MGNKTLEDFLNEEARKEIYSTYSGIKKLENFEAFRSKANGLEVLHLQGQAKDRFHAYQLDLKDKENERLKKEIEVLKEHIKALGKNINPAVNATGYISSSNNQKSITKNFTTGQDGVHLSNKGHAGN